MEVIKYQKGYKYQLVEEYVTQLKLVRTNVLIDTDYVMLTATGLLIIKKKYAWDGPSGPTVDTPDFMRGSLVHDALYQLMREGHLPPEQRRNADKELHRICLEDGMNHLRAAMVYEGVRLGAGFAVKPSAEKPVLLAP